MEDYIVTIAFQGEVNVQVKSTDFESARIVARTIIKKRNVDIKDLSAYCVVLAKQDKVNKKTRVTKRL